ncbi:23S rRNA (adenine(2503)-C(2))-methyltransferase RlmN [Myxococcota bacterium]|nr:23S rRNA (adenine(2503)-C(2))-methyltransferase RlmN [Myxococcota bacterium]MBU1431271.1 23S rRNA (adenine(2503)-C(2))-methyltransferase RlmN [Myxococcota bacterium]MBU1900465.1 23S rRNA (adenine(2503)-C(2))-methyltransferase RlmN [Myxococcota bacterium]
MPSSKHLVDLDRAGVEALVRALKQPSYRAAQLYQWIFKHGARDLDEMTNLPKALRAALRDEGWGVGRARVERVVESVDGTRKLALRLAQDGAVVEAVLLPMEKERGRYALCVSSQVGCAMACAFCYTGTLGLARHLSPGEIVDQLILARAELREGERVGNVIFMGMGEPLHNFDNVVCAIERMVDPEGVDFTHRKITVSTSGLVPKIDALGAAAPVNIALSLNATTDEQRDWLMPVNRKWPIREVLAALRRYPLPPRRKMTIEYVLLGGVNDTDEDAHRLARLLRGMPVRVNLIPWNPFGEGQFKRPDEARVLAFQQILKAKGLMTLLRVTRGLDIDAACGQLGERPQALQTEIPGEMEEEHG